MSQFISTVDFSPVSELVIMETKALVIALKLKVTLLHVASPDPSFIGCHVGPREVRDSKAQELRHEHQMLDDLAEEFRQNNVEAQGRLVEGATVGTILREAEKLGAEYIVVGSSGHGALYNTFFGSVSSGVIAGASCPVLVVPVRSNQAFREGDSCG
jgi:nucleotide-binding universal stress UspA family protein